MQTEEAVKDAKKRASLAAEVLIAMNKKRIIIKKEGHAACSYLVL